MKEKESIEGAAVMERGSEGESQMAGKYLTFNLANEEYGLQILKVKEIIGLMKITRVPRTPDYIRGMINLRGKVIPVMGLRNKFSMEIAKDTEQTCIIVVDILLNGLAVQMGILVDSVSEVLNILPGEIEDAPKFGAGIDTAYILGIGKAKGKVIILLDIDRVMTSEELKTAETAAGASAQE